MGEAEETFWAIFKNKSSIIKYLREVFFATMIIIATLSAGISIFLMSKYLFIYLLTMSLGFLLEAK